MMVALMVSGDPAAPVLSRELYDWRVPFDSGVLEKCTPCQVAYIARTAVALVYIVATYASLQLGCDPGHKSHSIPSVRGIVGML